VAATTAEGAEDSSEVVLTRADRAASRPVVVRVDRYGTEAELRSLVRERLRAAARTNDEQDASAFPDDRLSTGNDNLAFACARRFTRPPPITSSSSEPSRPLVRVWMGCKLDLASISTCDSSGTMR